jgi:hypothetical protein
MALLPGRHDITVIQGADWTLPLRVLLDDGTLLDTADSTARMQIRASIDAAVALELTTANGRLGVGYDPPPWEATTAYGLGQQVVPTTLNGFVYEATVAGTSDVAEPTWPTTIGQTVVDDGVTWECVTADTVVTNVRATVLAAVSEPLSDWGLGRWDIELADAFGHVQRLLEGQAVLSREVTR